MSTSVITDLLEVSQLLVSAYDENGEIVAEGYDIIEEAVLRANAVIDKLNGK